MTSGRKFLKRAEAASGIFLAVLTLQAVQQEVAVVELAALGHEDRGGGQVGRVDRGREPPGLTRPPSAQLSNGAVPSQQFAQVGRFRGSSGTPSHMACALGGADGRYGPPESSAVTTAYASSCHVTAGGLPGQDLSRPTDRRVKPGRNNLSFTGLRSLWGPARLEVLDRRF